MSASGLTGRPGVFAVDDGAIQVTWRDLPAGTVAVRAGDAATTVAHPGGPGDVRVAGLPPWTTVEVTVSLDGRSVGADRVRTAPPGPGAELFRFATISDLHLGEQGFGYFGTMKEKPAPVDPHPVRCLRRALAELDAWGAQLLIVKGDITNDGRRHEWELAAAELGHARSPVAALIGNHDARPAERPRHGPLRQAVWYLRGGLVQRLANGPKTGETIDPADGLAIAGLDWPDPHARVHGLDGDGLRIILADTTIEHRHIGTYDAVRDEVAALAADARRAGSAAFVAGHHFPMPLPVPHFWPPGVPASEATRFFTALASANPDAFYTAGHTHRHRRYRRAGIPATEVGSPKDYPGTWAGYTVYEGGIRQTVWRVGGTDVLGWTERSRRAALGAWGLWSPGRLGDRCFLHRWPSTG